MEARDSSTVVIRIYEDGEGPGYLQCLNFETPDLYWITVGWNREWFRRVSSRRRPNKSLERRVKDKVPSSNGGARAAQLNR